MSNVTNMDNQLLALAKSFYDQTIDGDGYTHTEAEINKLVSAGYIECEKNGYCKTTDKFHRSLDNDWKSNEASLISFDPNESSLSPTAIGKSNKYLARIEKEYPDVPHMIPPLPDNWERNWVECKCGFINVHDYIPYGAMMPDSCSNCGATYDSATKLTEGQAMTRIHANNIGLTKV